MVVLYTTHCPKCNVLTKKLDQAQIKYEICEDADIMREKGFSSAPVLEVNGEFFSFKEAVVWIKTQN